MLGLNILFSRLLGNANEHIFLSPNTPNEIVFNRLLIEIEQSTLYSLLFLNTKIIVKMMIYF